MKYLTSLFLALSLQCFACYECEELPAKIWKGDDDKYYLLINLKHHEGGNDEHIYVLDRLVHSEYCRCQWWRYDY